MMQKDRMDYKEMDDSKLVESIAHKEARLFALAAVAVSTLAMVSAAVLLPMLFTAMHGLHAEIAQETDFCRLRLRDFWHEMYTLEESIFRDSGGEETMEVRRKRAPSGPGRWIFGTFIPDKLNRVVHAAPTVTAKNQPSGNAYDSPQPPLAAAENSGAREKTGLEIFRTIQSAPPSPFGGYGMAPPANDVYGAQAIVGADAPPSISPPAAHPPATSPVQRAPVELEVCCCCQGPPGETGDPGDDGPSGSDGAPGAAGDSGHDGSILAHDSPLKEPCVICPIGSPGASGPQGPRGPTGPRGSNGVSGTDGKRGEQGMEGPPGPIGNLGPLGAQGPSGLPGRRFIVEGPRGPTGKAGPKGPNGLPGCQGEHGKTVMGPKGPPGDSGRAGKDGHRGQQGPNGKFGERGVGGDCYHCPLPRTPPGY